MLEGWFDMPKTPKIAPRLNGTPEIRYVRAQIFPAWHDTHRHALSRRSRASLRPLKTTSRTPPCTARRVGVHKAMDHSLAQMQSRMRSCDRRTPSTVKTCTHTAHSFKTARLNKAVWPVGGPADGLRPPRELLGVLPRAATCTLSARMAGVLLAVPERKK